MICEGLASGSDGVLVGACKRGECHYSSGNLHAEGKIGLVGMMLQAAGLRPERVAMRMMSSAEGGKFAEYAAAFQQEIGELGPLGQAEGVSPKELTIKLNALRKALGGRKLRWVTGRLVEFKEQGNLYGERFTDHEVGRLLREIAMDELRTREIIERLGGGSRSVRQLAEAMDTPPALVLRQMADLRRMGMADIERLEGASPLWALDADGVAAYE
jgi:hypothetical protein